MRRRRSNLSTTTPATGATKMLGSVDAAIRRVFELLLRGLAALPAE
jgi:hypothetical protein